MTAMLVALVLAACAFAYAIGVAWADDGSGNAAAPSQRAAGNAAGAAEPARAAAAARRLPREGRGQRERRQRLPGELRLLGLRAAAVLTHGRAWSG